MMSEIEKLYKKDLEQMGISELPDFVEEEILEILKIKRDCVFCGTANESVNLKNSIQYLLTALKIAQINGMISEEEAGIIRNQYEYEK